MYNELADPTVLSCTFVANELNGCSGWLNGGAGMYNDGSSPTVTGCLFTANDGNNGGGMMNVNDSNPIVRECVFQSNVVTFSGGGMNNTSGASALLINCLVLDNLAYHGAGLYTTSADIQMVNCTVTGNLAQANAAGLYVMMAPVASSVANCIFWNNTSLGGPQQDEIVRYGGTLMTVNNSNVEDGWSGPGWANIDADPHFVDPQASDFRLETDSPSLDGGLNLSLPPDVTIDLDGEARIVAAAVDMGAYEVQQGSACAADLSGDGMVNVVDLIALMDAWGACDACQACPADLSGDCTVTTVDLAALIGAWGACE
jgi:hypothetical protein